MNIEKLTNGIILIGIGILFLLSNLGMIHWSIFHVLLQLWPLILIVVGINLILKNRYIVVIITWLLFFAAIITYGFVFHEKFEAGITATNETFTIVRQEETTEAKLDLNIGAAKVSLDSKTGHLIYASINPQRIKSNVKYRNNQKEAVIQFDHIKLAEKNISSISDHYQFSLNDDVIWHIDADMGASSGDMDFSSIQVKKLDLDVGASNLNLKFGDTYHDVSEIDIDAGASNIDIILSKTSGVKLKLDGLVSKGNVEVLGWQKTGDYYYSPNYQEAASKLHFDVSMGVGKFGIGLY
ncbi:hypothetical protein SAMN05446037_100383 [Anaerovirgula multivorans]|uniref:LiaI-LiaF-like transmembrane region domain-containing protein n=1 Tax=Anaerovirgula multivorans TaxID=312168 RepID=A0A239B9B9_9FIRM|nr:DUF5668 domain-containing protein [Anaerovirgula multivorans]SNS04121.1 hypothetical protein SAMN05446037_100383 [Anaerovirgula multivorans]